jgi:regulator of replication initiation timing
MLLEQLATESLQQQIHSLQEENRLLQIQFNKLKEVYSKTIRENMELKKK